jgi:hypothetical protein
MKLGIGFTSRIFVIGAFVIGANLVHAAPITYTVDLSGLGFNDGSVNGTIETDGALGTLGSGDIVSYSLLLNDGIGQTFTLDPGDSSVTLNGTATTATTSLLQFNYDTPDVGALGYFEILDSAAGWGLAFAVPPNQPLGGIVNPDGAGTAGLPEFDPQPITIGTAATPEPSTVVVSGLCLLGVVWRRRWIKK